MVSSLPFPFTVHFFPSWRPWRLHEEMSSLAAMGPSVPRISQTQLHLVPHARGDASKILAGNVIYHVYDIYIYVMVATPTVHAVPTRILFVTWP